jgi:polysaccharide deacetylase 2 family uncharacterized protein YibQ
MRNERGGIFSRLIVLALLGWGAWFLYNRWWPANNPQAFSGRLESVLAGELTRSGVTDRDVLSQLRKERSQWGLTWVQTRRSIRVSRSDRIREVGQSLAHAAKRLGCSVETSEHAGTLEIRIKRFIWTFQTLTLVSEPSRTPRVREKRSLAAFVVDDVAYETSSMDRFAALGVPLTFAILPREKHSAELARKANGLHCPVMLHLPMEPKDRADNDPGPSGLYLNMTDAQLQAMFEKDVASVPGLVGINNHMGSAFTENRPKMDLVMGWVKKKNLYFLDSRTTAGSVACQAAVEAGVPCLANQTFLDNEDDVTSIKKQLDRVMDLAVKKGRTIAIGHYRRKHLVEALKEKLPEFQSRGVQIVALPSFYKK